MKVLIVDDEKQICSLVKDYISIEGYEVDTAYDGAEAIDKCRSNTYDIVLMDLMMPRVDGYTAIKEIRDFSSVPIIVLSARTAEYDKIKAFGLQVDDYIDKPFSLKELSLRISAVLRRSNTMVSTSAIYTVGELQLDDIGKFIVVQGDKRVIPRKEYEMLRYMMQRAGTPIAREAFIKDVWGYDYDGFDRTIDTHIKLLRKDISPLGDYIVTIRGMGYKIEKI